MLHLRYSTQKDAISMKHEINYNYFCIKFLIYFLNYYNKKCKLIALPRYTYYYNIFKHI